MTETTKQGWTPGPWEVSVRKDSMVKAAVSEGISTDDFPYAIFIPSHPFALGALGALVCEQRGILDGPERTKANANLIAKAPEMAELIGWIKDHGHDWEYFPKWVRYAERLLRELEGK